MQTKHRKGILKVIWKGFGWRSILALHILESLKMVIYPLKHSTVMWMVPCIDPETTPDVTISSIITTMTANPIHSKGFRSSTVSSNSATDLRLSLLLLDLQLLHQQLLTRLGFPHFFSRLRPSLHCFTSGRKLPWNVIAMVFVDHLP